VIKASQLYSVILIVMFLFFLIASQLRSLIDFDLEGIEYYAWIGFACVISFLLIYNNKTFCINGYYLSFLTLFSLFLVGNYFYVEITLKRYLIGSFFTVLFILNYIIFYNVSISKDHFFKVVKIMILTISFVALMAYPERLLFEGSYQSYTLRGVKTLLKDPSFLATFLNINIVFCLSLYKLTRKRVYLFLVIFSLLTISMLMFIKALFSAMIICFLFVRIFYNSTVSKSITYFGGVLFFSFLILFGQPLFEEIKYKLSMYFGEGYSDIPRNALYIASFKIAIDSFPFGSGQGTFGSIPVKKDYSQIYYDYNLNNIHGLSPEDAMGITDSQFVFDTHWSSILGELGFVATILYLLIWFFPMMTAFNHLNQKSLELRLIAFITVMIFIDIFIESIAAPIPGQLQFIIVYAGLCASATRILSNESKLLKNDYTLKN
jgi:hypothetical protein